MYWGREWEIFWTCALAMAFVGCVAVMAAVGYGAYVLAQAVF